MEETMLRLLLALLIVSVAAPVMKPTEAAAQATCRQKCMDDENACLKRTGNKGQCGDRAKTCHARCK
jgi:hypothetical protein